MAALPPALARSELDPSRVWDEPSVLVVASSSSSSFVALAPGTPGSSSSSVSLAASSYRPSARDVALQEAVRRWAGEQRRTGGGAPNGESLAALVARAAPDEHGVWALVAAQQRSGLAASVAHLERQMRAVVLAAAGPAALGGSQALLPACAHYLMVRGGLLGASAPAQTPGSSSSSSSSASSSTGLYARVWLLLRCGASTEAAATARAAGEIKLADAIERGHGGLGKKFRGFFSFFFFKKKNFCKVGTVLGG